MKCIKSIKPTKNTEIGHITRIDDVEAEVKVKSGYWAYVPKSEWKLTNRKPKTTDQVTEQVTDQVDKKPYKKGERSEKHKNK